MGLTQIVKSNWVIRKSVKIRSFLYVGDSKGGLTNVEICLKGFEEKSVLGKRKNDRRK